ncbi:MAG TPA: methyltransferase domain-containing protein [Candidatus Omnitrophota bacterium]|nr:methyltransferase domain-containing protein [Candidatus Omnitrophota bacterium]HPD84076.1 methyltransferase domain-containing protein [Candidatus Omnitrophota bacterium]HRZ02933.1 methyltransferase domain-containing protein [Candidatus Omnitrophota bacterium]
MFTEVRCHLCGSDSYDVVYNNLRAQGDFDQKDFYKITDHAAEASLRIVCCRRCGFTFLNPLPDQTTIVDNYVSMVDDKYLQEEKGRRASARSVLNYLNSIKKDKGVLLDIGCAAGFLLDEARKDGWEVYGVELSRWAVGYARKTLCLGNIVQGTLKDANFSRNFFDAVVMTDVIEHLIQPKTMLEEIRPLLKPNGVMCCATPDVDSLVSRLLGAKWWGIKCSHLHYFNKFTLDELFRATGFTVAKIRSHARTFSLGYWVENFASYKPSLRFIDSFLKKYPKLAAFSVSLDLGDQIEVFARKSRQIKYLHELEAGLEEERPKGRKKIIAIFPAYNAAKTLERTFKDIPKDCFDEIILIDDASKDDTVEIARRLNLKVFVHEERKGYGATQKTGYNKALEMGADIVVMVHPNYQYDPKVIPALIEPILKGRAEAVFGSRMMKGGALEGGMPLWKYNASILLTALQNIVLGIYLTEYHTGFRAYSRKYLTGVNFEANSNGLIFDTEIIVQGALKFMKFEEVPIRTRYFDEAPSIGLWPLIVYGINILKTLLKFMLHKRIWDFKQFE